MGYTYNLAQITRKDYFSDSTRSSDFNLLAGGNLSLAIGEYVELILEIDTTGNYFNGQTFYINFALFRAQQRTSLANFGTGWRVDITEPIMGTLVPTVTLVGGNPLNFNYNFKSGSVLFSASRMQLVFGIFITNDTRDWIGNSINNNTARWLLPFVGTNTLTQNAGNSAYRNTTGVSFFEIYAYETTNGTNPSSAFPDPFVRMPLNPTVKQISKGVNLKWYDTHHNNAQSWTSPTTPAYNWIDSIIIKYDPAPTAPIIANIKRAKYPTLTDTIDLNFEPNSPSFPRSLSYTGANYVTVNLSLGTVLSPANIDRVTARLIRTDNIPNNADFYTALETAERDIPILNATPAPNWLNGTAFGTPTAVVYGSPTTTIDFLIDGTKLQYKARYRLVLMVYDTTADFISTHISPEVTADFIQPATIGAPDTNLITYNTQHINSNDVTLSVFERFELRMGLDKTAYTGGVFDNELALVELEEIQNNNVLNRWSYSFLPNANNLNSRLAVNTNSITDLIMEFEQRAGYSLPLIFALTVFTYRWKFTFNQLTANGTQSNTYQMDMLIRVKPIDLTRINGITFLDAADFDISIETPIAYICNTKTEVVVKIEKNGAPNANLISLMLQNILPNPPVYENAAYSSPTGLSNINSPIMQQVETTFGDNFAYYRIDLNQIRGNNNILAGALIYDI